MLFLVPHLFPSTRLREAATQNLRLTALETLLARGTLSTEPGEGIEAALCEAFGIARQQDWPLAPITLEADGGAADEAYWLRADPVHLRLMRDRIVLTDNRALNLSQEEAEALAATIGEHFGAGFQPLPLRPHHWYLRFPAPLALVTTPLSVATGCAIAPLLPRGDAGQPVRAQLNEVQMLLHAHPVNAAREARGQLAVNALWLWGGGTVPRVSPQPLPLYSGDETSQALGVFCGAPMHALPSRLEGALLEAAGVVVLDLLSEAGQCGDAYGWREAIIGMETNWFQPLLKALRNTRARAVRLVDPISGRGLQLGRSDAWKLWRRPHSLASVLP